MSKHDKGQRHRLTGISICIFCLISLVIIIIIHRIKLFYWMQKTKNLPSDPSPHAAPATGCFRIASSLRFSNPHDLRLFLLSLLATNGHSHSHSSLPLHHILILPHWSSDGIYHANPTIFSAWVWSVSAWYHQRFGTIWEARVLRGLGQAKIEFQASISDTYECESKFRIISDS